MPKTLPRNADVADQFDLLADFLELEGSDQFRPLAYRRAAQRMRETGGSIAQLAVDGKAKELSGIGKTIEEKIVQIVETGKIEALAKREERTPPDVVQFMRLPGLGPKTARRIGPNPGIWSVLRLISGGWRNSPGARRPRPRSHSPRRNGWRCCAPSGTPRWPACNTKGRCPSIHPGYG